MSPKLFVGNLHWSVSSKRLREAFAPYGEVEDARVMVDDRTGVTRGFGFITMATQAAAEAARAGLSGAKLEGQELIVDWAKS